MAELDYETRHALRPHDFAVLAQFGFKYAPVGFKFFNVESELEATGLQQIDGKMPWCRMLLEAQRGKAFYATAENQSCEPGIFLTGHGPLTPLAASGRIGAAFDIFPDERANRRIYNHISKLAEDSTFATGYAPVDKLTFDPDLVILLCDDMDQTEKVFRAIQWDTGDIIVSKMTYVMGCNWMFTYPYVTGDINIVWTGLCHGMRKHDLHPAGLPIISIPWHHLDRVLRNIAEMPWTLPAHTDESEAADQRGCERLGVDGII